jgi:hypothetical protein
MERDRRLTGTLRGQTDNPQAPFGFEFTNGWKVIPPHIYTFFFYGQVLTLYTVGKEIYLETYCIQSELLEEGNLEIQMKENVYTKLRVDFTVWRMVPMKAQIRPRWLAFTRSC